MPSKKRSRKRNSKKVASSRDAKEQKGEAALEDTVELENDDGNGSDRGELGTTAVEEKGSPAASPQRLSNASITPIRAESKLAERYELSADKLGYTDSNHANASMHASPASSDKPSRPVSTPLGYAAPSAKSSSRPSKPDHAAWMDKSTEKEVSEREPGYGDEGKIGDAESKAESKSQDRYQSPNGHVLSASKAADNFSSPQPTTDPPNELISAFRSARKAIENSADIDKSKRRQRSDSLDEVLKDHPQIVNPDTGEISGNMVPSEDVLQHHRRTNSARELVNLSVTPSNSSLREGTPVRSPKKYTAIALSSTAKALEGKLRATKPKRVERRPSIDILMESGILIMPEINTGIATPSPGAAVSSNLVEENRFLTAMLPHAARARVTADSPLVAKAFGTKQQSVLRDFSAPAFSSPLPPSVTHIYQYVPYKILDRKAVVGIALRVISELKIRDMISDEKVGLAKDKLFRGDISVVMAVEQFANNQDLELLVALLYDIAVN